ncbi:MAG: hypothetical protein H3C50_02535 [Kiritimatiellae bacterium]|nr:hypothetical protein [Kiritimatiellia bacterium]MCO5067884.1 hypothetical protein [Kiritimatiellia bacterium]
MRGWAKTLAILLGVAPMFGAHAALTWVGHATASPQNGFIEATDDIWINIEATPLGDPTGALVVYSTNNGATWSATNMQANGDPDHDGVRNWDEWMAGTSPTDGLSFLGMQMPADPPSTAGIIIQWQSVTGKWYTLDRATNLTDIPAFVSLQTNIAGQANSTVVTDQTANGIGPYFYRVGTKP